MKNYHVLNAIAGAILVVAVVTENLYWLTVTVVLASIAVVTALEDLDRDRHDRMTRIHLTNQTTGHRVLPNAVPPKILDTPPAPPRRK